MPRLGITADRSKFSDMVDSFSSLPFKIIKSLNLHIDYINLLFNFLLRDVHVTIWLVSITFKNNPECNLISKFLNEIILPRHLVFQLFFLNRKIFSLKTWLAHETQHHCCLKILAEQEMQSSRLLYFSFKKAKILVY